MIVLQSFSNLGCILKNSRKRWAMVCKCCPLALLQEKFSLYFILHC